MFHSVRNKFPLPASWHRAFVVTFVFVTLAAGLFWLDFFRGYRAEVTALVISRPGVSQSGADIAENLAGLTRTLSFYDRVLADNDLIDDAFDGYAPEKRKALWNETVSVQRSGESSVLVIRASGDETGTAQLLASQTARTLFSVAGLYYNVKTDIDVRIIDGPLTSYVLEKPFFFVVTSFATGLSVTVLFFLFLKAIPGFIGPASSSQGGPVLVNRQSGSTQQNGGRKKEMILDEILKQSSVTSEKQSVSEKAYPSFAIGETVPWIDPKKFIPTKPATLSFEATKQGKKKNVSTVTHAPAPANLPIAPSEMNLPVMDETTFPALSELQRGEPALFESHAFEASPEELNIALSQSQDESMVPLEVSAPALVKGEPTVEEYKRRLNKLLSGGN